MADGYTPPPADPVADGQGYPNKDEALSRIQNWDKLLDAHWSQSRREKLEAFEIVAGRQWTKDEIADMELDGKVPVVFNRVGPTIDAVSGAEISSRQQVQYLPRQVGASALDDILTQGAQWIMDECDGDQEDSDAFRDCLICGEGWTETRPDFDLESQIVKERVDPLEMSPDASSRKPCFADARYLRRRKPMSKEAFEELFPNASPEGEQGLDARQPVIVDPRIRYDGTNEDGTISKDEVVVREYQWFDREPRFLVGGDAAAAIKRQFPQVPMMGDHVQLEPDQHAEAMRVFPGSPSAEIKVKVFWKAFVAGQTIIQGPERIEADDFTYKAITGKRDRNKGVWYGLVRPMADPQKWANKFYSQILHILRTNANGGVVMEEDAASDQREFEDTWADPAKITVVRTGALSNPNGKKIEPKPNVPYPQGLDRLMEIAVTAVRDTTGVNQEMLGSAERDQPGILESQRKQQAFGILAAFFDAKRRYHRMQGRLLLKLIDLYMPADKLVRIVGQDNGPQYVPLALSTDAAKYDVIVDEAPAGPNQKMQTFQVLTQLMPLLQNAGLGADVWADIARYSPLPASLAEKIASSLMQKQKAEQAAAPQQQQLEQQGAQAKIANEAGSAQHHVAQANLLNAKAAQTHAETVRGAFAPQAPAGPSAEETQAKINLDRAKTSKLLTEVVQAMEEPQEPKE